MSKHKKKDKVEETAKARGKKKTSKKAVEETPAPSGETVAAPAEAKTPARRKTVRKPVAKAAPVVTVSQEEVGLRAYFIAEHRQRHGLPGDEVSDWVEAERQLLRELAGGA